MICGTSGLITRRTAVLRLAGVAGGLLATSRAAGEDLGCLQDQTVRWLVGYTPGGGYDAYARLVEPFLERALEARIMIQNLPGAAGAVALRTLADARPDGRTIGIFDGPGALWSVALRERGVPDPARDLTMLARVTRLQQMLVTGPRSGARRLDDLLALGRRRRLVFGATATSSQNFVTCAVTSRIFGLEVDYVVGYPGSRELTLALIRGDVDVISLNVESGLDAIGPEGITPLFLVAPEPVPYAQLERVPRLGAPSTLEPQRRDQFAGASADARELGDAIGTYLGFGRIVAAPAGLHDSVRRCLQHAVWTALRDPELAVAAARAQRTLAVATADQAQREMAAARAAIVRILPIAAAAARRAR